MGELFCGNCGAKTEGGYSFCPVCGKPLMVQGDSASMARPQGATVAQPGSSMAPHPLLEGAIRLNPGEALLRTFRATSLGDPRSRGSENASEYSGLMLITDQRIAFIAESGVFQKKYSLGEAIDLDAVQMVDVEGFLDKCLVVRHKRFNLTYPSGFDDFMEVDPMTLKGMAKVPLPQAQKAIEDALARRRGRPS